MSATISTARKTSSLAYVQGVAHKLNDFEITNSPNDAPKHGTVLYDRAPEKHKTALLHHVGDGRLSIYSS
jgi:hypothetical protein